MTASLLFHPLPESTMATLASLASDPGIFADFLCDGIRSWASAPLAERTWDVLAWFLRDERSCQDALIDGDPGKRGPWRKDQHGNRWRINPDRLFPGPLSPAALGAWLTAVGDGRAESIANWQISPHGMGGFAAWRKALPNIIAEVCERRQTEAAAWLDIKRRCAAMFGELSRTVEHRGKHFRQENHTEPIYGDGLVTIDYRYMGSTLHLDGRRFELRTDHPIAVRQEADGFVLTETLCPIDLLPAPTISASWDTRPRNILADVRALALPLLRVGPRILSKPHA